MRRAVLPLLIALLLAGLWAGSLDPGGTGRPAPAAGAPDAVGAAASPAVGDANPWLPPEARGTLALIAADGPYPYRRDGVTFENREDRLPAQPRGYYREFTVPTPGASDRGARRIVAGGDPPEVLYYTADHYRSFRRIEGAP